MADETQNSEQIIYPDLKPDIRRAGDIGDVRMYRAGDGINGDAFQSPDGTSAKTVRPVNPDLSTFILPTAPSPKDSSLQGNARANFQSVAGERHLRTHFRAVGADKNGFVAAGTGLRADPRVQQQRTVQPGVPEPLDQRDVIQAGPASDESINDPLNVGMTRVEGRLINFRHILETGEVPMFSPVIPGGAGSYGMSNQSVDWGSDDAYIRAVDKVTEEVTKRIHQEPEMQKLLDKDQWTLDDRKLWEKNLSRYVSDAYDEIPGLNKYRIQPDHKFERVGADKGNLAFAMTADRRAVKLNDLSTDIRGGTGHIEYDCEAMSITEGATMQRIEDSVLPHAAGWGL